MVIVRGVLFGSSNAHVEIRKKLIEENRLDGVVSMPSGVFRPYAGVSTAVLLFTTGASTERMWFYDVEHDGFSLDDKRQPARMTCPMCCAAGGSAKTASSKPIAIGG
jgi:type I restriction enzyme M protein